MKYRVHVRDYIAYGRPALWQSYGLYEFGDALVLMRSLRECHSNGVVVGVDAWMVPL